MQFKDQYIKILRNFLYYNPVLGYDGSKVLRTKSSKSGVIVEADIPDFTDLPIYTKDLTDILKFVTPETEIEEDSEGDINYLVLKSNSGTIRYRLSDTNVVMQQTSKIVSPKKVEFKELYLSFNIDYNQYKNIMHTAKLLECDAIQIYSIDEHKIGMKAVNINDKKSKQFIMEIECEHTHTEQNVYILLENFELVAASDYNINMGVFQNSRGLEVKLVKIKAFCGNVEVNYMIACKEGR